MLVVFTIGYTTRKWKVSLDLLRAHGIKRMVDVRSIPRARHNPQFNRETLSIKLRSARIGYVLLCKLELFRPGTGPQRLTCKYYYPIGKSISAVSHERNQHA